MSGFQQLYDPATGLVGNRNDPRYAMAQKLVDQQAPQAIPGAGASVLTSLSGIMRALAANKLMGDAKQDGKDAAAKQDADYKSTLQMMFGGDPSAAAAPSATPAPVTSTPLAPPAPSGGGLSSAVHGLESSGRMDPGIFGDGGAAAGPMQVHAGALEDVNKALGTSYTHQQLAAEPAIGKLVGDKYLAMQRERFGRDDYAFGAYNAGPGAMQAAIDSGRGVAGLPGRAPSYVQRGMAALGGGGAAPAPAPGAPPAAPLTLAGTGITAQPGADVPAGLPPAFQAAAAGGAPANPMPPASLATPAASPTMGEQMAGKLGGGAWQSTPSGAALASRIDPAAVSALQRKAAIAATSSDPRIARLAPQLQAQAQNLQTEYYRQQDGAERSVERNRADQLRQEAEARRVQERREDEARRRGERLEDRVPMGYRKTADGNLERIKGGPADQADSPKAPVGYRFTADGKSLEFIPNGPADPALKEKPAKMPSDTVVKGVTGNMTALRNLDNALAAVEANPDAFGASNYVPGIDRFAPAKNIDARGKVADIGSLTIHERSGAATSVSEMDKLKPFIPVATDTPDQVKVKLRGMRERVAGMLQEQYEVYGPGNGYKAIPGHGRALGVDEEGRATSGADGGGPPPPPPGAPGANANATQAGAKTGPDPRKLAAVEAARKALGPNATDDDVLRKAQELFGR